jgi:hypothetical protein
LEPLLRQHEALLDTVVAPTVGKQGLLFPPATALRVDPHFYSPVFQKWFQNDVLLELVLIKAAIEQIDDQAFRQICEVSFSAILRRKSNASTRYPNVMFDKHAPPRHDALTDYKRTLRRVIGAVAALGSLPQPAFPASVSLGDARSLPFPDAKFDAVITHPPYIGSVPYAEYQLLSLIWQKVDPQSVDRVELDPENWTGG